MRLLASSACADDAAPPAFVLNSARRDRTSLALQKKTSAGVKRGPERGMISFGLGSRYCPLPGPRRRSGVWVRQAS
jgi:hypothetical protein